MGKMKELYTAIRANQQLSDAERDYKDTLTPEELADVRSNAPLLHRKLRDEHLKKSKNHYLHDRK